MYASVGCEPCSRSERPFPNKVRSYNLEDEKAMDEQFAERKTEAG
jgi:hypothetical protein